MNTRVRTSFLASYFGVGFAVATLAGCNDQDPPVNEMGSETAATETAGDGDGDGDTVGDGDGDSTGDGDGDGEPSCGALGCECTPGSCNSGLSCTDGTCQVTLCGDGEVQGEEDCEDGNDVDGDGCDNDCTFS